MNHKMGVTKTIRYSPKTKDYVECPMCKTKDFAFTPRSKVNRKRDRLFVNRMKFGYCEDCGVIITP